MTFQTFGTAHLGVPNRAGRHRDCEGGRNGWRNVGPFDSMVWVKRRDITAGPPCEHLDCTVCR